jgi:hypothetical protein
MFRYDNIKMDYEPYPVGVIADVFEPNLYRSLLRNYPPLDLFRYMPKLGNKYSLSSSNNPKNYYRYLSEHPDWAKVHDYIVSREFIEKTFEMLRSNFVDLGIKKYWFVGKRQSSRSSALSRLLRVPELSARFEFSMMNGEGGHIRPHTDMPRKLITFVFSMVDPEEWNPEWGGGTAVVWPKNRKLIFNHTNKYLDFAEVETVKEFAFKPNQALIFIKTFNSWHAVSPMRAPTNTALRKSITVNIESRA